MVMIKNRFFDKSWGDRTSGKEAWSHFQVFDSGLTCGELLSGFFCMVRIGARAGWVKLPLRSKYKVTDVPHQGSQLEQICHHDYTH